MASIFAPSVEGRLFAFAAPLGGARNGRDGMIKAVLWDMDGTLVDSEDIAVDALEEAMREADLVPPSDLKERVIGRSADEIYAIIAAGFGLTADPHHWEQRKHHHYVMAADALSGYDDALAVWRQLDSAGVRQAVVSNSDRAIVDINLRAVGLSRPGLVTVSRNDVRQGKPDPEGYLRAAYLLGVEPGECVIVEDSTSGAAAALATGCRTVFVPHSIVAPPDGVHPLADMQELMAIVLGSGDERRQGTSS